MSFSTNPTDDVLVPASDAVPDKSRRGIEEASAFDYAAMDERLGFHEPGHPTLTAPPDEYEIAGRMLGEILEFVTESPSLQGMGGRILGIAACLRPQLFENRPMSRVADTYGLTKQALSKYFALVRQRFGLKSIYHKSDASVEKYSALRTAKAGRGDTNE